MGSESSRLEALVESYRIAVEEARENLRGLQELNSLLDSLEAMEPLLPSTLRKPLAEGLARVRSLVEEMNVQSALEESRRLCSRVAAAVASRIAGQRLEADGCPGARSVKLLKAIIDASGPLSIVVSSLLSAGAASAEQVYSNAEKLAVVWQRAAKILVELYNAARSLERRGYGGWTDIALVASKLARGEDVGDALSSLEAAARKLAELSRLADALAEGSMEAAEALAGCEGEEGRPPVCRWLTKLIDEVMSASERLKSIPYTETSYELDTLLENARRASEKLSTARRIAERLLARLSPGHTPVKPLVELVAAMLEARRSLGFTDAEEELMIRLGEDERLDLIDLADRGGEYVRAALNLCRRGIAVCEVKMY